VENLEGGSYGGRKLGPGEDEPRVEAGEV
jgi:hypothetical protein